MFGFAKISYRINEKDKKTMAYLNLLLYCGNTLFTLTIQDDLGALIMNGNLFNLVTLTWLKIILDVLTQHWVESQVAAEVVTPSDLRAEEPQAE